MHVIWVTVKHNDKSRYGAWSSLKYDNTPDFKTLKGHSFNTSVSQLELQAIYSSLQGVTVKKQVEIRLPQTSEVYRVFTDNTLAIPPKLTQLFVQIDRLISEKELVVKFASTGKKDQNAMVMLDGPLHQEYKKHLKQGGAERKKLQDTRSFYGSRQIDALIKTSNASAVGAWAVLCVNSRGKTLKRKGVRKNNRDCYLDLLSISSVVKGVKENTDVHFYVSNAQTLILLDLSGSLRSRTIKRMVTSIQKRIEKKNLKVSFQLLKDYPHQAHVQEVTGLFQATKDQARENPVLAAPAAVNVPKVS